MPFRRGRFGVEYHERPQEPEGSWLWRALGVAFLVALVSLAVTLYTRSRARGAAEEEAPPQDFAAAKSADGPSAAGLADEPSAPPVAPRTLSGRPVQVRNLLLRLEEAERMKDLEMAISTIERIRALPGAPAADLDDKLARRLGVLNERLLFREKSAQWVTDVTVKRGQSASRIAAEYGSTLASLEKLNGDVSRLEVGRKLKVLKLPRFNLVVCRLSRSADLLLNGKFFKRYYLTGEVKGPVGAYVVEDRLRGFFAAKGIQLRPEDRAELEMLLPRGASVTISEMR